MNILLINHYAGSLQHGMEYRPYYLSKHWTRLGHKVAIVAANFSHVRTINPQVTEDITIENLDGVDYVWLKTPRYEKNDLYRVINMFAFIGQLLRYQNQLVRQYQPDIVIASSTYPLDIIPAASMAKKSDARLVYEVHDLWPLSLIEVGGMSRWNPFIVLLQLAENYAYRHVDYVVSLLPKAKEYMLQHGMDPKKFVNIPNGVDLEDWQDNQKELPPEHIQAIEEQKKKGHFIVGYAGAHGLVNGLNNLVNVALLLSSQQVTFFLVGQGSEKQNLQHYAAQQGAQNVIFLPPVPKASIPSFLAEMDALYIGLMREPLFRFGVSPNKLMDYLMAGKPIIQSIDAGNDIVAENACGISIPSGKVETVASAVLELMRTPIHDRKIMGQRGKAYVTAHHDYQVLAKQFIDLVLR